MLFYGYQLVTVYTAGSVIDVMGQTDMFLQEDEEALLNNDGITAFINSMPYPTLLVSHHRIVIAANLKLCDFLRLPYNTITIKGKNTLEVLGQMSQQFKNPEGIANRILEITAKQQPVYNDRIDTTDDRVIYRDYAPFVFNGKAVADMWIFYDATEQVKAADAIAEQKLFYEDILNKVPSDIAVFSPELKYLFVNPAAIRDEATRKWVIGKNDYDFCRERNKDLAIAERRERIQRKVLEDKKDVEWEEKMINRQGGVSYHMRKISPVLDAAGNIKMLIGYGFDITERKKFEEQVIISEKKFKDLFNYSQALICTHDMNGHLIDVNPAFCEQTGYGAEEAIGKSIAYFLPEKDKAQFDENYLIPVKNNQRVKGLFRVLHKNGSLVYLLYQNFRVEQPGEEPYIVSFSQDVTERVTMEKELKEAKKITEETAKVKEKFLANMSHEIRTPMNGIMGITALLQKTRLDTEQAEYLKIVQDSAQVLLNIINDILDLEKINSGNINLEIIPFDVGTRLKEIISLFTPVAKDKKLALQLDVKIKPGTVLAGDPTRFTQIMNNLISNAIKFTHEGGVTVTASIIHSDEETTTVYLTVKDTGIGIADKGFEKIFTPFTQAYPETTRMYGGTGLGLAITKNLVDMQNGRIWIDSKLNEGSTFHVEIPFKTYNQQAAMSNKIENRQSRVINKQLKVLLAEDNDINQLLANKILQHFGFNAKTANNGKEAVQMLLDEDFDVILMDIQMPVKNGIEAASEIRALADERKKSIPIIALTANALKGEEEKYFAVGMNGYLTKPFKEKELYETISSVLPAEYLEDNGTVESNKPADAPAAEDKDEKLYDLADLRIIQKDDEAFVKNIVGLFIANVPKNAAELVTATDNGDWDKVYFIAHKMKSSIELVNIESIRADVKRVELNAKTKTNLEEIPEKVAYINTVVAKASAQMKEEFGL